MFNFYRQACWSPKCNNCPKCNKVLNVITFGHKCNKVLNVITFGPQCNKPLMQSFNSFSALLLLGDIHIEMLVTAVAPKKPLTSIDVTLRARWYQSASFYLLDIRNISSRSMVLKVVYWSSWRKSFPAQSGLVLGWKLNRMESIGT